MVSFASLDPVVSLSCCVLRLVVTLALSLSLPGSPGSRLLYGGCSAGGLTSATHVDYVASLFPEAEVLGLTVRVSSVSHVASDSSFAPD